LLHRIRERASQTKTRSLRLGIGDDCALLNLHPGEELAITTDLSIAGRHFRLDWHQPESIGHRALARGLSDLAAMGARPIAAFLSLGLPRELITPSNGRISWVQRFLDGLLALATTNKTPLAGGDLSESPLAIADIVLTGAVPRGKALGGAAAGLTQLDDFAKSSGIRTSGLEPPRIPKRLAAQLAPHLYPQPRIAQGLVLQRRSIASAAIDISDGFSTDLTHICEESRVGAEVDAELLPIHHGATLADALHGGEDYELLFTAPAAARVPRQIGSVAITHIGRMVKARADTAAVSLITPQGSQPLEPQGWQHFS
jgi:thiamine-monophosphate kinase